MIGVVECSRPYLYCVWLSSTMVREGFYNWLVIILIRKCKIIMQQTPWGCLSPESFKWLRENNKNTWATFFLFLSINCSVCGDTSSIKQFDDGFLFSIPLAALWNAGFSVSFYVSARTALLEPALPHCDTGCSDMRGLASHCQPQYHSQHTLHKEKEMCRIQ